MAFLAVDNPVMHAELRHQRHIIRTSRSGWFWIVLAMLMVVPALLTAVVIVAAAFLGIDLEAVFTPPPWNTLAEVGVSSLMIVHFALYIVVTLVTLALAGSSISREQESRTWESLLLTEMSARQIVQGKWWATLRALWGDHLMVLIVRLGFVAWLDFLGSDPDLPRPSRLIVGLLVVTAFSAADSALSVILGILPPVSGRNPIVLTLALGLRLVVSVGILALAIGVGLLVHEWNPVLVFWRR
ncbi:MAG: hypothetical protein K8J31_05535, partial [Anaerolineae bacterium]|nr:hypothetical protein [Anaerolineae bacterium]